MSRPEEWRIISEFPDYSISNKGRSRRDTSKKGARAGRILAGATNNNGYRYQVLYGPNGNRHCYVHRLVARAFIGEPTEERPQVNHLDSNPLNNNVENLEWCSPSENVQHCIAAGRFIGDPPAPRYGEDHPQSKLTEESVREIRELHKSGISYERIAKEFGIAAMTAYNAINRRTWSHIK